MKKGILHNDTFTAKNTDVTEYTDSLTLNEQILYLSEKKWNEKLIDWFFKKPVKRSAQVTGATAIPLAGKQALDATSKASEEVQNSLSDIRNALKNALKNKPGMVWEEFKDIAFKLGITGVAAFTLYKALQTYIKNRNRKDDD